MDQSISSPVGCERRHRQNKQIIEFCGEKNGRFVASVPGSTTKRNFENNGQFARRAYFGKIPRTPVSVHTCVHHWLGVTIACKDR